MTGLLEQLLASGLPPFKTFSMQNRLKNIEEGFSTLQLMCAEYKQARRRRSGGVLQAPPLP